MARMAFDFPGGEMKREAWEIRREGVTPYRWICCSKTSR